MKLGEFLRFGRGEEKSGGRQKNALLADVFEAITGAIFLDGGLEAATQFVCRALRTELEAADPLSAAKADYKTMLQEKTSGRTACRAALCSNRNVRSAASTYFSRRGFVGQRQYSRLRPLDQNGRSRGRKSGTRSHELGRFQQS